MTAKIADFLRDSRPATPCLVLDLDVVADNYRSLTTALPSARVFYAVKANPAPAILALLVEAGSSFDCASIPEIDMVLDAGATPDRISFGNTIKKESDVAAAFERGVRLFAFDCEAELDKISRAAPGSRVFCRILTSGEGAEWPLSRKFGCEPDMAEELLLAARFKGVEPYGVSFHVGSQQRDLAQYDAALEEVAGIFKSLSAKGLDLKMVNMGGGFATKYLVDIPTAEEYGRAIHESLLRHFGNRLPETIIEPGRGMVGNAGVIQSEVVLISRKSANDNRSWVYLDIGKFGGLAETMDEAIRYPIHSEHDGGETQDVILAGPTCDSADILYEHAGYQLPKALKIGDKVEIRAAGAYTTTYASNGFNGFAPLKEYYI
ncbi:Ornithine decarboxylase [Caenispirillum salinarum AK4]|uniref:ornithine decarboxylase n=1 Tax=Caenispirillum salinarum AK4 TaxID=1238182 RepID=K9HGK9_9PROT|nr:type III PLP-dependent enzyme [Caenispirillum salinarum]EKV29583.1 Ornithine decarboxylase [Caenispirillum salinarum AK4]